jgi:hypothetical protein
MTCRVDRLVTGKDRVVLRLSGRITADELDVLRDALGQEPGAVAIDLEGVLLVDREAVRFLAAAEAGGVELGNCPPYVREWIARE